MVSKNAARFFWAPLIVVVMGLGTCQIQSKLIQSDPSVAPALDRAKTDHQPIITGLDEYRRLHGFFPKSLKDIKRPDLLRKSDMRYEVLGLNRVYKDMQCVEGAKEFQGFTLTITDYEQRLKSYLASCVLGYSNFSLIGMPIKTAWQINKGETAYTKFDSSSAAWMVTSCHRGKNVPSTVDCSDSPFNEAQKLD